jgi:hypothetical protein
MGSSRIDQLGLYVLSVILSYLKEIEGVRLLLTRQRFYKGVLPLFRLQSASTINRCRYKFVVGPVQDATVLLERLNTRRLFRRCRLPISNYTTWELAHLEWIHALNSGKHQLTSRLPTTELLRFCGNPTIGRTLASAISSDDEIWESGITLLASYPRSGNTLVRTLLERVTGLVTGSDTRPDRPLSRALSLQYGLVGEGVTNAKMVRVVKTHWPERRGCAQLKARRVILLVRNPYDVIDSYWNMNATNTHNQTVTDQVYDQYQPIFEGLVRNEILIWKLFIDFWCGPTKKSNRCVPLLLVRFEDLILQPAIQMQRILQFLLRKPLSEFWLERIHHVTCGPLANLGSYQPRVATDVEPRNDRSEGGSRKIAAASIGKSLTKKRYSEEVLQYLHDSVATTNPSQGNMLQLFGYDIYSQDFPRNFAEGFAPPLPSINALQALAQLAISDNRLSIRPSVNINQGEEIRPVECPYGRAMRQWRWKHTGKDNSPFPTVQRMHVPDV